MAAVDPRQRDEIVGGYPFPLDRFQLEALDALDRWIYDLGDEDGDLRRQLRDAKSSLETKP